VLFFGNTAGCGMSLSGGSVSGAGTAAQSQSESTAKSSPIPAPVPSVQPTVKPSVTPSPIPVPTAAGAGVTTLRPLGSTTAPYGYAEYLPFGYTAAGKYPLIIMLHGAGEVGNGTTDLPKVRFNGINNQIDNHGLKLPAIVVSPQTNQGSWGEDGGNSTRLDQFLDYLLATYAVDAKRVYMTGLSLGGGGTWAYAARHANRLAAIVPICGYNDEGAGEPGYAAYMVAQNLPVWAAHAVDDSVVVIQYSLRWLGNLAQQYGINNLTFASLPLGSPDGFSVNAGTGTTTFVMDPNNKNWIKVAGQTYHYPGSTAPFGPKQFLTVYPNGNHFIWENMYGDPQMYDWLFLQSR
jgi:predicted peptidase